MFYRVKNVSPHPDILLDVEFLEGTKKRCDVKPLMGKWPGFAELQNEALFRCVRVDRGGYGIVWNVRLDLSCDELWERGVPLTLKTEI